MNDPPPKPAPVSFRLSLFLGGSCVLAVLTALCLPLHRPNKAHHGGDAPYFGAADAGSLEHGTIGVWGGSGGSDPLSRMENAPAVPGNFQGYALGLPWGERHLFPSLYPVDRHGTSAAPMDRGGGDGFSLHPHLYPAVPAASGVDLSFGSRTVFLLAGIGFRSAKRHTVPVGDPPGRLFCSCFCLLRPRLPCVKGSWHAKGVTED